MPTALVIKITYACGCILIGERIVQDDSPRPRKVADKCEECRLAEADRLAEE